MLRFALLLACLALTNSHAVLPLVVPAVHVTAPYHGYVHGHHYALDHGHLHGYGHGYAHSYGHGHGLHGHGLHGLDHGVVGHHVWKRSPHVVAPYHHEYHGHAAVAPVALVAPSAVSHQSRVDVHSTPAVVAPVLKTVVAAPVHGFGHFGHGCYGAGFHGHFDGHYANGHYGHSHLGHY
jgi:hypothetical protein